MTDHGIDEVTDAAAFLARLVRLDRGALVRLRSVASGRTTLWTRLPWGVMASRTVAGAGPGDVTVFAAALLPKVVHSAAGLPPRQDARWRWPLPPGPGELLEEIPAAHVRRLASAAAETLREAAQRGVGGRAVGERMLRDALLQHVAVVVTGQDPAVRVEVKQGLVQGIARMGFLGSDSGMVQVRRAGSWVGLAARYGVAWSPPVRALQISPNGDRPKG